MVSKYDVFYVVASSGELRIIDILNTLNKPEHDYQRVFNLVLSLEREGFVKRKENVKIIHTEKSRTLFRLVSFCIDNNINYNLLFKKTMREFVLKAAKKEFFTIGDIKVHPQTFNFYVEALERYGFLLVISRKPLKCKLLRHHFLMDLSQFFGKKLLFYNSKQHSYIKEIKKELNKYKKRLKIHPGFIEGLSSKQEVNFIYLSLNLEGNPLTLPETQRLLLEDIIPAKYRLIHIHEVTNYKKALDLMIANAKKRMKLDLPLILQYHSIAMSHIPAAGEIRRQNVRIKLNPNFKTADWRIIVEKMGELMRKYEGFESRIQTIEEVINFAAFFHNEFQRIHPFIDGNSRISRLLMLHILRSQGIPLLDVPIGYFDLYLDLTKRSTKRDDQALKYLVEELVLSNLKKINSLA